MMVARCRVARCWWRRTCAVQVSSSRCTSEWRTVARTRHAGDAENLCEHLRSMGAEWCATVTRWW